MAATEKTIPDSSQDDRRELKQPASVGVPPKPPTEHTNAMQSEGERSSYAADRTPASTKEPHQLLLPAHDRSLLHRMMSIAWKLALFAILFPIVQVAILRFVDPPFSTMMVYQAIGHLFSGEQITWHHSNVDRSQVSPSLYEAILAGEDQRFYLHHGFDMQEIENAEKTHARHPKRAMRGASTISQQTAKNLFLPPWHSYIRKGVEAYYTVLMEFLWPKSRILEVYANIAEFAPNVYGAEAGAEFHFKRHAKDLTQQQAAQMAAVLPNPERWSASHPSAYIQRRAQRIVRQMHGIPTEEEEENDQPD